MATKRRPAFGAPVISDTSCNISAIENHPTALLGPFPVPMSHQVKDYMPVIAGQPSRKLGPNSFLLL